MVFEHLPSTDYTQMRGESRVHKANKKVLDGPPGRITLRDEVNIEEEENGGSARESSQWHLGVYQYVAKTVFGTGTIKANGFGFEV